jgi:formate dehydrogenase subunit gamma
MSEFALWNRDSALEIVRKHCAMEGAALPILHALQEAFGFIHEEAVPLVAEELNLTRAEVHGIVTFYHDFRSAPAGRHVVKLCRAEACQSMGADRLAEYAQAKLGAKWGDTTRDGAITLEPVFCLGLCACAPSAMVDGRVVGRLDEKRLDALLDGVTR